MGRTRVRAQKIRKIFCQKVFDDKFRLSERRRGFGNNMCSREQDRNVTGKRNLNLTRV